MSSPFKIGITGGIGSGKSLVANALRAMGYPVYDSDSHAKLLMITNESIRTQLRERFGDAVYENGQLNRTYLANRLFEDPEGREAVHAIVHPVVRADFGQWVSQQSSQLVFQESALLFETGGYRLLDATVLVTAPEELRLQRVMQRDGLTAEQVKVRMAAQLPDAEKAKHATTIIVNDGEQLVVPQVLEVLKRFEN